MHSLATQHTFFWMHLGQVLSQAVQPKMLARSIPFFLRPVMLFNNIIQLLWWNGPQYELSKTRCSFYHLHCSISSSLSNCLNDAFAVVPDVDSAVIPAVVPFVVPDPVPMKNGIRGINISKRKLSQARKVGKAAFLSFLNCMNKCHVMKFCRYVNHIFWGFLDAWNFIKFFKGKLKFFRDEPVFFLTPWFELSQQFSCKNLFQEFHPLQ